MKVFLIGSHGVGKTTLVKTIQKELDKAQASYVLIPELPRFLMENLKFHWDSLPFPSWLSFQKTLAEYYYFIHQFETGWFPVLSDRSLLDVLAYVKFAAGGKWENRSSLDYQTHLCKKVRSVLQHGENHFYFYSLNNQYQDISQLKIEEHLQEIIKEFSVKAKVFTRQDLEDIKNEITSLLMEQGKNKRGVRE